MNSVFGLGLGSHRPTTSKSAFSTPGTIRPSRHAPSLAHVAKARSTRQNYTPLTPPNPENLRAILASSGISDFPKADIMNYLRRDSVEMARNGPHLLEDPVWGCVHITDDIPVAISDDRTTDNPSLRLLCGNFLQ